MPAPIRTVVAVTCPLALVLGCNPDCDSPSRLDGMFSVNSAIASPENRVTGNNIDAFPGDDVFISGYSEWSFVWVPAKKSFDLEIDGQPYEAFFSQSEDNCDAFRLDFEGLYDTGVASFHDFLIEGEFEFRGPHFDGVLHYRDEWFVPNTDTEGAIDIPEVTVTATKR